MSKSAARKRREAARRRRQRHAEPAVARQPAETKQAPPPPPPPPPEPEPEPEPDPIVEPIPDDSMSLDTDVELEDVLDTLDDDDVAVDLECGSDSKLIVYKGLSVAEAAETAAGEYVTALGRFPDAIVSCTCYTPEGATFGPFPVQVMVVAEAECFKVQQ